MATINGQIKSVDDQESIIVNIVIKNACINISIHNDYVHANLSFIV